MAQPGKSSIKRGKPSYFMSILGVTLVLLLLGIIGWLVINATKLGDYFKESVGYIDNVTLENGTYFAVARLKIKKGIDIPSDSRAIVSTSGLLGGKYIRINPGSADDNLQENGKFKFTQSSINIEDLISKLMYSLTSK